MIFRQKAKQSKRCDFPNCEICKNYIEVDGKMYCNVPMVISKQKMILTESLIAGMQKKISDLEDIVYKEL